jgi:hypothetical protein
LVKEERRQMLVLFVLLFPCRIIARLTLKKNNS